MASIEEAKKILSIAANMELEKMNAKELSNFRKTWGAGNSLMDYLAFKKTDKLILFVKTTTGNVVIDVAANQDIGTKVSSLVGDIGQVIGLAVFAAKFNVGGLAITLIDNAMQLAGLSLGDFAKFLNNSAIKWVHNISKITLYNGVLGVQMKDGTIYKEPIDNYGIDYPAYSRDIIGSDKDDVLFGGAGNDYLSGLGGKDILIGGKGADHYATYDGDTVIDEDGLGYVTLRWERLYGGKWNSEKNAYIGGLWEEEIYTLDDKGVLTVKRGKDTITIRDFDKDKNSLGIVLQDADEILVSVSDAAVSEKSGKINFKISLSRKLEKGETLKLDVNGEELIFEEGDQEKIYQHIWKDNNKKEEDREFNITPIIKDKSENLKAKVGKHGTGKIIDDDRDPNEDLPEIYDPIVIDFNKNGITSTKLDNTVYFDHDNNGFAEATAWVEKDDGLLALDKNNNGKIDNGNELFGNHTISNTAYGYTDKKATNGYEALKAYDLNGDNVIDEKDEIFNKLKIWKDKNSNGITDEGELSSLADNNIKSIGLNYKEITINENSNTVKQGSKAALIDEPIYEWAGVSEAAKDSRGIYRC